MTSLPKRKIVIIELDVNPPKNSTKIQRVKDILAKVQEEVGYNKNYYKHAKKLIYKAINESARHNYNSIHELDERADEPKLTNSQLNKLTSEYGNFSLKIAEGLTTAKMKEPTLVPLASASKYTPLRESIKAIRQNEIKTFENAVQANKRAESDAKEARLACNEVLKSLNKARPTKNDVENVGRARKALEKARLSVNTATKITINAYNTSISARITISQLTEQVISTLGYELKALQMNKRYPP